MPRRPRRDGGHGADPGGAGDGSGLYLPVADGPAGLEAPEVSGTREDDGTVFTGGQTERMEIAVEADRAVEVRDLVPEGWSVIAGDVARVDEREDGSSYVYLEGEGRSVEATYFLEAPSGPAASGEYGFGPLEARAAGGDGWVTVPDTGDSNLVGGVEQP